MESAFSKLASPYTNDLTILGAGEWWIDAQWLAHLIWYGLLQVGGFYLVVLAEIFVQILAVGISMLAAKRAGASPRRILLGLMAAFALLQPFIQVRAQTLAWPLVTTTLYLIVDHDLVIQKAQRTGDDSGYRHLWWGVPLTALWTNLHGSVLAGTGLLGLTALLSLWRLPKRRLEIFLLGLSLAAAPLISPYWLPPYWLMMISLGKGPFPEYHFPTFSEHPSLFLLAGLTLIALILARKRIRWFHALMFSILLAVGMKANRYGVLFALGLTSFSPFLFEALLPPGRSKARNSLHIAIASTLIWLGGMGYGFAILSSKLQKLWPHAVLQIPYDGNIITSVQLADWMLFERPDLEDRILVDVRLEVGPIDKWLRLVELDAGETAVADEFDDIRWIIFQTDRAESGQKAFGEDSNWEKTYEDEEVVVFHRTNLSSIR